MKDAFPSYYPLTDGEREAAFSQAVFVFDSSVLLNLYRYQAETRDTMLRVLEKLKQQERVWIPYHVGLEYQRNRLTVIIDQSNKFADVKSALTTAVSGVEKEFDKLDLKKRHSDIDPDLYIDKLSKVVKEITLDIEELEKGSLKYNSEDSVRDQLDDIFSGCIGPMPKEQQTLDTIFKEGEHRFNNKIPPGYEDRGKSNSDIPTFTDQGLHYDRQFGDFVIWKQLLDYAQKNQPKSLVFVVDDAKEDWWHIVKSGGKKTMGPRVELLDEMRRLGGVESFHMYSSAQFLKYAKDSLHVQVGEDVIEDVRVVARAKRIRDINKLNRKGHIAHAYGLFDEALLDWVREKHGALTRRAFEVPRLIAERDGVRTGIFIVDGDNLPDDSDLYRDVRDVVMTAYLPVLRGEVDQSQIVYSFSFGTDKEINLFVNYLKSFTSSDQANIFIAAGALNFTDRGRVYQPFVDIGLPNPGEIG